MTIPKFSRDTIKLLRKYGQQHLLSFWNELTDEERCQLIEDIENIDLESFLFDIKKAKERSTSNKIKKIDDYLEPPSKEICGRLVDNTPEDLEKFNEIGLKNIVEGKCCVVLMAGGAGTRLGVDYPKGMFKVGLPSEKSLFQIQAERLIRLQSLAREKFNESESVPPIMWYIMTSDCTRDATIEYFSKNNYFGLCHTQVVFFEQLTLPVIGINGKILLDSKFKIAKSPDGNGGLYRALREYNIIDDMKRRGIKYVHVYGVDNILIKIADPIFFGFFIESGTDCATKVVEKKSPSENVGVVAKVCGHYQIVEYSEINKCTAELRDLECNSKLMYRWGSICSHLFHINFLERVCQVDCSNMLIQHIALKKVPNVNIETGSIEIPNKINAIKMEKFVFDVFPFAKSFVIWEAERSHEFSPLKNSDISKVDCPETSKMSILNYHKYLIKSNLTDFDNKMKVEDMIIEISPLVSYNGESLGDIDKLIREAERGSTLVLELNKHEKVVVRNINHYQT